MDEVILCSVFRHHMVRESGSLKFQWQHVSIHWNNISIIMSCFLQSCAAVINEPKFSFVDCEIGEYHFTGAGGYSLVLTAARPISQHRTSRQRSLHVCNLSIFRWKYGTAKASGIMTGDDSDHDPGLWCLWCLNLPSTQNFRTWVE